MDGDERLIISDRIKGGHMMNTEEMDTYRFFTVAGMTDQEFREFLREIRDCGEVSA